MENTQALERRLENLEIKASFTDDLLDQLNLTIYRQQEQIDRLIQQLAQLRQQMPEAGTGPHHQGHELPPHY
ncbi:SlyX family protein [Variovorax sp. ZT4R33]|uniref:SlyX family protein n=1 Tax=Variovorax sp. ZT4R33 TaxID=3443743 RepID=UPI003F472AD3